MPVTFMIDAQHHLWDYFLTVELIWTQGLPRVLNNTRDACSSAAVDLSSSCKKGQTSEDLTEISDNLLKRSSHAHKEVRVLLWGALVRDIMSLHMCFPLSADLDKLHAITHICRFVCLFVH